MQLCVRQVCFLAMILALSGQQLFSVKKISTSFPIRSRYVPSRPSRLRHFPSLIAQNLVRRPYGPSCQALRENHEEEEEEGTKIVKVEDSVPVEPAKEKTSYLKARLRAKLCSLKEIVAFQKVPDGLDEVIDKMRLHNVPQGTRIFQQGEAGDRMYIIESGAMEIMKSENPAAPGEKEVRVGSYQPGECVGHLSLLDSRPRAASAVVTKESVLWSLDRKTLQDFMAGGVDMTYDESEDDICVLPREVFVISDSTGESAVSAVRKCIMQFTHCDAWEMCNIVTYRFVNSKQQIKHVAEQADRRDAIIVYTIVDAANKQFLEEEASKRNVSLVDL